MAIGDKILTIMPLTPRDVQHRLASRFRARRLSLDLSQEGLAARSGVTWSSLKRFERTGLISLAGLLKLAVVLDCLQDFDQVCAGDGRGVTAKSLDELLAEPKPRARGRRK